MKTSLPLFLHFLPVILWTQTVDSVAIRQVDSLIQVSRALTAKNDFVQAMEINEVAEKIALEKLGRESAAYGSCCFNHSRLLFIKGDYPGAEKWCLEAKTIREIVLGEEHPYYVTTLNSLGLINLIMGQNGKAELFFLEAKDIQEKTRRKEHSDYAFSLQGLADVYRNLGQYEKAEPLYLEAITIKEKTQGKDPDFAKCLHNLAILYVKMGQYGKAELRYQEAREIFEGTLGKNHPLYSQCLNSLALLYVNMGRYEDAEPLFLEAIAIQEKTQGKANLSYAHTLNNMAILYRNMGQYEKAEPLCLESIAITRKIQGNATSDYAGSLINLANIYGNMGQYEKAEPLYQEAKVIFESFLNNRSHNYYWNCLNGLAILYENTGQYEKAEMLFREVIVISEKALGKEHPDYARSLNNLASFYRGQGQYEKAEPLDKETMAIREKALGKEHPDYAQTLNNLAILYRNMGQYEKSEPFILESIAIREKVLGKEHPDYAYSLFSLASLYLAKGEYEDAEPFFLQAIAIREKALGKEDSERAIFLHNLADFYLTMGRYDKAEPFFLELSAFIRYLTNKATRHLSELELNNYLNKFAQSQNQILSFTQFSNSKSLIPVCYDNSLFYKGFLLNAANQVKHLALSDSASTEKYNLLKSYQRRLASQYALPIAERDSARIADLELKSNDVEKDLARTVAGFGEAMGQVNWQEVQAVLKPGEAAIEFVHYRYHEKAITDSTMYAALVLRPGDAQPLFISLFEEKQLDSLLQTQGARRADYVNNLYTMPERGVKPLGKPQKTLYELLWQPLEGKLAASKTIYFSPSGLLHRLNLGAIPISDEVSLADQYHLVELNSTRQLVIPAKIEVANLDAVLYGGIQYDMDSTAIAAANQGYGPDLVATRGELAFSYTDSTDRDGAWSYLKWTAKEADQIETILTASGTKVSVRKAYNATEASFKTLGKSGPSPRILHLATHGFFFPDPQTKAPSLGRGLGEAEPVFKLSDHPMIRSGLILAGGNHAWQTGKPLHPNMEDGILTAYEISQMNLSNTELVVLSACETGLGDIQGNEGVYGLQRAFKIAGAKYLIMSLWQVPDRETSVFMETFYRHWIVDNMTIPDAFRATQQAMRERFVNPYQWAGFVLVE